MTRSGFHRDFVHPQPGSWLSRKGVPVDLMVPEALAAGPGRRGARIPPHSRHATRRTAGLEAAVVDHAPMTIAALDATDARRVEIAVAGPGALLVSKLHKSELAADQLAGPATRMAITYLRPSPTRTRSAP